MRVSQLVQILDIIRERNGDLDVYLSVVDNDTQIVFYGETYNVALDYRNGQDNPAVVLDANKE